MKAVVVAACAGVAAAQSAGSLTKESHPRMDYAHCTESGCKAHSRKVTIDSNWRWTHKTGETTNCYTGNLWDESICPDPVTCAKNCEIDGADKEYEGTYGVFANAGRDLTLKFVTEGPYSTNVGSRLFMLDSDEESYKLFRLKNREFTFDVNVSNLPCGLNGALYFVAMDQDGGKAKHSHNTAGAKYGTGYCDAQCPHDIKWINGVPNLKDWIPQETDKNAGFGRYGSCCMEVDIWEANSISQAFSLHSCNFTGTNRCEGVECGDNAGDVTPEAHRFEGVCDKNGCDYATYRLGEHKFYGPGSDFTIDSTKPMTVTTQFLTEDGTDEGKLSEMRRFYWQDGKKIENVPVTLKGKQYDSVSTDFCTAWADTTDDGTNFLEKGGVEAADKAFETGMVLVMSLWDDHLANMLWLDSKYPIDTTDPTMMRGTCGIESGVPADVEKDSGDASVTFSNIKYGDIGTTTTHTAAVVV